MPHFAYKAREGSGSQREGVVEAIDQSTAALGLVRQGLYVSRLEEIQRRPENLLSRLFRRPLSRQDLSAATRQLSDLLEGGLPLVSALEILGAELSHPGLRDAFLDVQLHVEAGERLSSALQEHPRVFSVLYSSMVASGEAVGRLPEVLRSIADRLDTEEEVRRKVRAALVYPGILLCVGLLTTILLVTFVIPRLAILFDDMGQTLPLPTRMLVGLSHGVTKYGWLVLPLLLVGVLALRSLARRPEGRAWSDRLTLDLPIVGRLIRASEVARFGRTMATLLRSGLSLLIALEVVESTAASRPFKDAVAGLRIGVAEGFSLSQAMKKSRSFSLATAHVVAVGEGANDPATALDKVADMHKRELEATTRVLTSVIEPMLVVAVGLVVGFIVFAMMLPILQIDISGLER